MRQNMLSFKGIPFTAKELFDLMSVEDALDKAFPTDEAKSRALAYIQKSYPAYDESTNTAISAIPSKEEREANPGFYNNPSHINQEKQDETQ